MNLIDWLLNRRTIRELLVKIEKVVAMMLAYSVKRGTEK